ncbi:SGNH/GDSL hydrolase family protein [Roseovarius sp. E0-M6]|uniref:SGNH/GDSL hydrolase family protein n=1 Tax=Roseovarius sp. E0-M6 TaxID=3127118 RepID=UPI00300F889A
MRPILAVLFLLLAACTEGVPADGKSRVLMMGDSLFGTHQLTGQSVGHALERRIDAPVTDRSVIGARMIYALPISGSLGIKIARQYRAGPWKWVVLNGGGNDLWFGCGCGRCKGKLDRLISPDGTQGEIPKLLARLRGTGAQVIYVGYLRSPGLGSPIEHCKNEADGLEGRIAALAKQDPGLTFLSLSDLVPEGDRSYHALDMIHPSPKGARAIAGRIADVMQGR